MSERKFKRMFFDIETSPNIVLTWGTGYNITIDYKSIVKERAIICICWKWADEKKVHYLTWDKNQNDKIMLKNFIEEMNKADEIIGHNSDRFDIKWIRTRALFHRLKCPPDFISVDTLKLSKNGFKFNSNTLDYLGKYLGVGGKLNAGYDLWKKITLNNCEKSLVKMVRYCKNDVKKLEDVFNLMKPYVKHKTHKGVFIGRKRISCPECTSFQTIKRKVRISSAGYRQQQMQCTDCGKYFTIPESKLEINESKNTDISKSK